jgi:hypothetical protein
VLIAGEQAFPFSTPLSPRQAREQGVVNDFWKPLPSFCCSVPLWLGKGRLKGQFIYPRGGQIENEALRKQTAQLKVMHYILNTECLTIHFTAHFLLLVNAGKHSESELTFFVSNIFLVLLLQLVNS